MGAIGGDEVHNRHRIPAPGCRIRRHEERIRADRAARCTADDPGLRPGAVEPVAVAQRHAHEARQKHRHRAPAQLARGRDAAQQRRRADRPDRHEPRRRVQPRLDAHREGSGPRQPSRSAAEQPAPLNDLWRSLSPRSPVVVFNARTGGATPSGPSSTPTRPPTPTGCCSSVRPRTSPRASATSSCCATSRTRAATRSRPPTTAGTASTATSVGRTSRAAAISTACGRSPSPASAASPAAPCTSATTRSSRSAIPTCAT